MAHDWFPKHAPTIKQYCRKCKQYAIFGKRKTICPGKPSAPEAGGDAR